MNEYVVWCPEQHELVVQGDKGRRDVTTYRLPIHPMPHRADFTCVGSGQYGRVKGSREI